MSHPKPTSSLPRIAALFAATWLGSSSLAVPPGDAPWVTVARPISRDVSDSAEFIGTARAARSVEVRARVGGKLDSIHLRAGSVVEAGAPLFEIDPAPYRAEMERSEAAVALAKARLARESSNKVRFLDDRKRSLIGREEFDRAMADIDEAEAAFRTAQATCELAWLKLDGTSVVAPIRGRLSAFEIPIGGEIEADRTPLARIDPVDSIFIDFDIDERTALKLARRELGGSRPGIGLPVQVGHSDETGFPHAGKVDSVDARLDPDAGTLRCRAMVSNLDGLMISGMFARVRLVMGPPTQALLVAERAIVSSGPEKSVWVLDARGAAKLRKIKVGPLDDNDRVVREGLAAEDRVILNPPDSLKVGATIRVEPALTSSKSP